MRTNRLTVKMILHWKANIQDCIIRVWKTPVDTSAELIFNSKSCDIINILENRCAQFYCTNWIEQY